MGASQKSVIIWLLLKESHSTRRLFGSMVRRSCLLRRDMGFKRRKSAPTQAHGCIISTTGRGHTGNP